MDVCQTCNYALCDSPGTPSSQRFSTERILPLWCASTVLLPDVPKSQRLGPESTTVFMTCGVGCMHCKLQKTSTNHGFGNTIFLKTDGAGWLYHKLSGAVCFAALATVSSMRSIISRSFSFNALRISLKTIAVSRCASENTTKSFGG